LRSGDLGWLVSLKEHGGLWNSPLDGLGAEQQDRHPDQEIWQIVQASGYPQPQAESVQGAVLLCWMIIEP
jgi:hypothetical protein